MRRTTGADMRVRPSGECEEDGGRGGGRFPAVALFGYSSSYDE
ncbi:hypothetical protein ACFOEY_16915 [Paracandidimonas soli]